MPFQTLLRWSLPLLVLPAILPNPASAQPVSDEPGLALEIRQTVQRIQARAAQGTGAYELVADLTTEVGPRFAGTAGDRAAVAWALTRLQQLGFEKVHAENVSVPRWERGETLAEIAEPFPQVLVATALGGSIGTGASGIHAPVVQVGDLDELKSLTSAELGGKIVYISRRMQRARDGSGYSKTVPGRRSGPVEAARRGAVALMIRSVGTSNTRLAHTGAARYAQDAPRIPAVAISNPDADLLERQLATGKLVRVRLTLSARMLGNARSANVVADIPGDGAADEIILLGAHLDSWDLGTGAVDDGAGVAIVIETARLIAELSPRNRRTLRVVLYANEEFGQSGANAYVSAHRENIALHQVGLEADTGAGKVWRLSSRVADNALEHVATLHALLAPLGIERGGNNSGGGADLRPLQQHGMPVLALNHDMSDYFDIHHTANDTLDKIDPGDLDQAVSAYATVAYVLANWDADLGRLPVGAPPL